MVYRLFKRCQNLPAGHCVQVCRMLKWCKNLPARHGVAGVQAAVAVSEPTCWALCCRGAGCFSGVGTYLPGTVFQVEGCLSGIRTYLPGTVLH